MKTEKCIVCGIEHTGKGVYCALHCMLEDAKNDMKAFKAYFTQELGKELFQDEWMAEEDAIYDGVVLREDYPYGDVAAENCANL